VPAVFAVLIKMNLYLCEMIIARRPEKTGNTAQPVGRLVNAGEYSRNWRINRNLEVPFDDLFSETISFRSHTENRR
jgi:hypothetical protein